MPELPEVETIVRALREGGRSGAPLPGRVVRQAHLYWERTLAAPAAEEFYRRLAGQRVDTIYRRGKYVCIQLDADILLVHLRMSGDLLVTGSNAGRLPAAHVRAAITFTDGTTLVFNDPRKFGRIWLVNDPQTVLSGLGPEPLDETFTPEEFHRRLAIRHSRLKPLLLDQSFLAGMGNIYTDEALHQAGLHPAQPGSSLGFKQSERLLAAIRSVLNEGIRANGASIDWVYRGGTFQNNFRVYRRTGEPCRCCNTSIERIQIGQRGTHYCPSCQPLMPSG